MTHTRPDDVLTPKQVSVLALLAEGLEYEEVARRLLMSLSAVKLHAQQARNRLGARNTAHAVARGYEQGVIGRALEVPPRDHDECPPIREGANDMTTTPAPTDVDFDPACSCRRCGKCDRALGELAKTRAELDEAKREVWALNNSDDGRVVILEAELAAMTKRRDVAVENAKQYRKNWDSAVAANMTALETIGTLKAQRDAVMTLCATTPDAELDTLPQRIRAAYDANPATTAEAADEPKATACNGNCIHQKHNDGTDVVIEDLCCPRHGLPAAS